jgi:putative redox protein
MSRIEIALLGAGDTAITRVDGGATIRSSKSPAFGGSGASFSSTDLLSAALGSCIATNIEPVADRHGVDLGRIGVTVDKTLSPKPKRIERLDVRVVVAGDVSADNLKRFDAAAQHCLVHKSLADHVVVTIEVVAGAGVEA